MTHEQMRIHEKLLRIFSSNYLVAAWNHSIISWLAYGKFGNNFESVILEHLLQIKVLEH